MENATKIGVNHSGIQMSPLQGREQVEFAASQDPDPAGDAFAIGAERMHYIGMADRLGSVPVPATGKGLLKTAAGKFKGANPEVLIDKLGQRLAYERSGVRLYEAMIMKAQAAGCGRKPELLADLNQIREEEESHFHMLTEVIRGLGADPTAQTPGADVSGVATLGLVQVITDPSTTVAQCLEALLTAELTDHACWELLIELAREQGEQDMAAGFDAALAAEARHLHTIREWLRTMLAEAAR